MTFRPHNKTNRFNSSLHQRDSRSALFEGYTGSGADSRRGITPSPSRLGGPRGGGGGGGGYGYGGYANGTGLGVHPNGGFRPATPNRKGQYSDAVLNELESQNDAQVEGIMGKVRILKDVRKFCFVLPVALFYFSLLMMMMTDVLLVVISR